MPHRDRNHVRARTLIQRWQKAMHVIEMGQLQKSRSMHEFDAATCVRRSIPKHPGAHTVGDARGYSPQPRIPPGLAVSHDELEIGLALALRTFRLCDQRR